MENKVFRKLLIFVVFLASLNANVAMASFKIPEEIIIEQQSQLSTNFDIIINDLKIGEVKRNKSDQLQYDFFDLEGMLRTKGRLRKIFPGIVFEVTDHGGKPLGSIEEYIYPFFHTYNIYSPSGVVSPYGEKLAEGRLNFLWTKLPVYHAVTHKEIAVFSRPFFRPFKDVWTLKISDPSFFEELNDISLFILIAVIRTDYECWGKPREGSTFKSLRTSSPLSDEQKEMIQSLRSEFDLIRYEIEKIEPDIDDLNIIEEFVEAQLPSEKEVFLVSEQEQLMYGLHKIMPLLERDLLTPSQKYGLYLIIEQKIQELERSY